MKAKVVRKITVEDPDTRQPTEITVLKQSDGKLVGVDLSVLDDEGSLIPLLSPYSDDELEIEGMSPEDADGIELGAAGIDTDLEGDEDLSSVINTLDAKDESQVDKLLRAPIHEYAAHDARNFLNTLRDPNEKKLWMGFAEKFSEDNPSSEREAKSQFLRLSPEQQKLIKPVMDKFIRYMDRVHFQHSLSTQPPKSYRVDTEDFS
jgi:hypothetical protein